MRMVGVHLTLVFPVPGTEGPVQGGHWKDSQMCVFPENLRFQGGCEIGKDIVAHLARCPCSPFSSHPSPGMAGPGTGFSRGWCNGRACFCGLTGIVEDSELLPPHPALSPTVPRMTGLLS